MAPSAMRALNAALERGIFDRAYFFHGDDEFLKEENVRALIAHATDKGTRDFNLDVRRAGDTDAKTLLLALDALPLMAARRVIVLRDVAALKKDARIVLDRYLDRPAADTVLVLTLAAGAKVDDRLAERTVAVEFKPLKDEDLSTWAQRRVSALGGTISRSALELLCSCTGNDLALLAGEIEKLLSYANGKEIDDGTVAAIVGVRRGETLGDLLELVAVRNAPGATTLLERVLAQPKTSGVSIVMALTTQTLAIGWALAARNRGLPQHQLEGELFGLLKENASSLVGRPWGDGVRCWVRALRNWDDAAVDYALKQLLAADTLLKDTRVSSDEQVLASLILSLGSTARRTIAA
jgi:DNA polymerase-3 subunit delta